MNELVLPSGVDKLSLPQKALALGLVGVGLYFALPVLLAMMVNLLMVVVIGVPIAFAVYNYQMVWLLFKNISWKATKFLIGLDVLSYMDRYLEWVTGQEQILIDSKTTLVKELEGVSGQINQRDKSYQDNMRRAEAAQKAGNQGQLEVALSKASSDKDFIGDLSPIRDEAEKQVAYLSELTEVFQINKEKLGYTIEAQRSKYNSLKAMSGGMRAASTVISGAGGANAIWKETNNQLISQMNQFTANIKTFEEVVKPAIEAGRFDKQLRQADGMRLLEEFRKTNFELKKGE